MVPDVGERARLELVNGDDVKVKLAYLDPVKEDLPLVVYPGDTLTQARLLYAGPQHCQQLLALRDSEWNIQPNFHFGFIRKGLAWTTSTLSTDEYVAYWIARIDQTGVFRREDWDAETQRLIDDGIMTMADNAQFTADFETRGSATPRPGLRATRCWPQSVIGDADFPPMLRAALREILDALGASTAVLD
jgi:hypothetical protein